LLWWWGLIAHRKNPRQPKYKINNQATNKQELKESFLIKGCKKHKEKIIVSDTENLKHHFSTPSQKTNIFNIKRTKHINEVKKYNGQVKAFVDNNNTTTNNNNNKNNKKCNHRDT